MRHSPLALASIALLLTAATAYAVKPQAWNHTTEKDFSEGKFDNTLVDSYGQLTLGRKLTSIPLEADAEIIPAFAQTPDGALYVAANGPSRILQIDAAKTKSIFTAPKDAPDITALAADAHGNLLVAVSGDDAKLLQISPKKPAESTTLFHDKDATAIWAIAKAPDGATYLGTGPHGTVYKLDAAGKATKFLETKAKNIVALAFDKDGNLIAGTDSSGLVIRVDKQTAQPFVLLDAGKTDVSALLTDDQGNLYVATAAPASEDSAPGMGDEGETPATKSKPGKVEPEPTEPPDDLNAPSDQNKPPASKPAQSVPSSKPSPKDAPGGAMIHLSHPTVLADLPDAALMKALESLGKVTVSPLQSKPKSPSSAKKTSHTKLGGAGHKPAASEDEPEVSSAVYRITPDGAVETIVSAPDANYALLLAHDELLIATGQNGKLFAYRPAEESLTLIARLHEEQISSLFADRDGAIFLGTASAGKLYTLGTGLAQSGTYLSPVLDAKHSAHWGRATLTATLPDAAEATLATRTGNTRDVETHEKFWSPWSGELPSAAPILSPTASFLQYRVTLTGDGKSLTPSINGVRIAYQVDNLPPKIKSVTVESEAATSSEDPSPLTDRTADAQPPSTLYHISWDATDPNHDTLTFRLLYRQLVAGAPELWVPIAKDLKEMTYDWDIRSLPDGQYQVKVIASDSLDNSPAAARSVARVSPPLLLDQTPPVIGEIKAVVEAHKVTLEGVASDAASNLVDLRYQIDGQGDWQPAAPSDKLSDSPTEVFTTVTRPLSTGGHRITLRATDAHGNCSYKSVTVTIK